MRIRKIMGLLDLFRSKESQFRHQIRSGYNECVKNVLKKGKLDDTMYQGLLVQGAIGSFYQTIKKDSTLWLIANQIGIDSDRIIEEERDRAIRKYLK